MRLHISLDIDRPTAIPLNYGHLLTGVVYHFLEQADADYAEFLHDKGYAPVDAGAAEAPDRRRFKLFTFSLLWAQHSRLDLSLPGDEKLLLQPGRVEWWVTSPVEPFLRHFATGLLNAGCLRLGAAALRVAQAETVASPFFISPMRFKCLSPIVAAVTERDDTKSWTRYLRPKDPAWSERVRHNLLGKYAALHARPPLDDRLTVTWDAAYLKTHKGTKLVDYKGIKIVGAWCPFAMSGSPELMRTAYACGLGEKNAGFGMIEAVQR